RRVGAQVEQTQDRAAEHLAEKVGMTWSHYLGHLDASRRDRFGESFGHLCSRLNDPRELDRVEARATHEAAVDVGHTEEFGRVGRLHAAAVENPRVLRQSGRNRIADMSPDEPAYSARLGRVAHVA